MVTGEEVHLPAPFPLALQKRKELLIPGTTLSASIRWFLDYFWAICTSVWGKTNNNNTKTTKIPDKTSVKTPSSTGPFK